MAKTQQSIANEIVRVKKPSAGDDRPTIVIDPKSINMDNVGVDQFDFKPSYENAPKDAQKLEGFSSADGISANGLGPNSKGATTQYAYPIDVVRDDIFHHMMVLTIFQQKMDRTSSTRVSTDPTVQAGSSKPISNLVNPNAAAFFAGGTLLEGGLKALFGGKIVDAVEKSVEIGATYKIASAVNLNNINKGTERISTTINLYMPDTIITQDRHDYQAVSLTEITGLAGLASAAFENGAKAGFQNLTGSGPIGVQVAASLGTKSGVFGEDYSDAALQATGYALNPMLEILYRRSMNREFNYQFRFTPRNQAEANEVKSIIKTLRFHAAPSYANGNHGRFFIPPSQFGIEYWYSDKNSKRFVQNPAIPKIGRCVLSDIDVNYAPSGQYSTFKDGMPVEITLNLRFTELVVLTKNDIINGF